MYIERIQVEEGFLHGVDLRFSPGLNVLIGARGTGKTSIIELIRFCLGAEALTERSARLARAHALSILQSGQVRLTLDLNGEKVQVTRSAQDTRPRASSSFPQFTVLGQGEIENVGLEPSGRVRLVDLFRSQSILGQAGDFSSVRSLTIEVRALGREIENIDQQLAALAGVPEELKAARADEQKMLKSVASTTADQTRVRQLEQEATNLSVSDGVLQRASQSLDRYQVLLRRALNDIPELETWPDTAIGGDLLAAPRKALQTVQNHVMSAEDALASAVIDLAQQVSDLDATRLGVEDQLREFRRRLEQLQQGAGALTKKVAALAERAGHLEALTSLRGQRLARLRSISEQRWATYKNIESLRRERYSERVEIAERLNRILGPKIRVSIRQSELDDNYVSAIVAGLRGSGLHYNSLAPILAARLSPRELVEAIEERDFDMISRLAELQLDRAARVVEHLADSVEDLLAADIDDSADLALFDGDDWKTELSTGQRCTVVLSILLARHGHVLLVDQPEDNLDNAFVTDTLIKAIGERKGDDQMILATHNANIPVLGDADLVAVLGSDGRHGHIKHAAPLDDPLIVASITSLMEGGLEAFLRRAAFYRRFEHS
jgi:RecF/RecN/SMC N terminal domain.